MLKLLNNILKGVEGESVVGINTATGVRHCINLPVRNRLLKVFPLGTRDMEGARFTEMIFWPSPCLCCRCLHVALQRLVYNHMSHLFIYPSGA